MKFLFLLFLILNSSCKSGINEEKFCDRKSQGFLLATIFYSQRNESYCYFGQQNRSSTTAPPISLTPVTYSYSRTNIVFLDNIPITNLTPTTIGPTTTYRVSPALPNGLVLNSSTGVISGTASSVSPETNYTFTASGTNTTTANFVMKIRVGTTTAIRVYGQSGDFSCGVINRSSTSCITSTPSANSFNTPFGVSGDLLGGIYISDPLNNRVLFYEKEITTASRVYGQNGSFSTITATPINADSLSSPRNVFFGLNNILYISDFTNNRVLTYSGTSTTATGVYGQNGSFLTTTTTPVNADSLNFPQGVVQDSDGGIYIADGPNQRVLYYANRSTTATRVYGQNGSFTTNTPGTTASTFNLPVALALDSTGGLFVVEVSNNRVLHFPKDSAVPDRVYGQFGSYTCTNSQNNNGSCVSVIASPSANSLSQPRGIAVDAFDNVYISDTLNHRILFYQGTSTTPTRVYGQAGSFSTQVVNNGGISASSLNLPVRLYIDPDGGLYAADQLNNRILYY